MMGTKNFRLDPRDEMYRVDRGYEGIRKDMGSRRRMPRPREIEIGIGKVATVAKAHYYYYYYY